MRTRRREGAEIRAAWLGPCTHPTINAAGMLFSREGAKTQGVQSPSYRSVATTAAGRNSAPPRESNFFASSREKSYSRSRLNGDGKDRKGVWFSRRRAAQLLRIPRHCLAHIMRDRCGIEILRPPQQ